MIIISDNETIPIPANFVLDKIDEIFSVKNISDEEFKIKTGTKREAIKKVNPNFNTVIFRLGYFAASVDEILPQLEIIKKGNMPTYNFWFGVGYYFLMRKTENNNKNVL